MSTLSPLVNSQLGKKRSEDINTQNLPINSNFISISNYQKKSLPYKDYDYLNGISVNDLNTFVLSEILPKKQSSQLVKQLTLKKKLMYSIRYGN